MHWFQKSNPQNKTLGIAALETMSVGKVVVNTADEDIYGKGILHDGKNYIKITSGNPEQVEADGRWTLSQEGGIFWKAGCGRCRRGMG